jgi:hypothetical protein
MAPTPEFAANLLSRNSPAILVCSVLLLGGFGSQLCLADMNPPKPITAKTYVPRTPKILRLSRPLAGHTISTDKNAAIQQRTSNGKHMPITARSAWQKRVSSQFSQASQAGTISTLLHHN